MKNRLMKNIGLRILALFVAVLIWMIVVNVSDPITSATFSNVPVEILNSELITGENQTYEILNDTDSVTVTVSAKRSISDMLSKDNIRATADMSEINVEDETVRIRVETNKYNSKIESIKSKTDYVELKLETLERKQFAIRSVVNGDPVTGYEVGDILLDQNVVTVQGPESIVSDIDYATAEVSVAGMSGSISTTSTIRYYNSKDEMVSAKRLTSNITNVGVKVELLATKELPLNFNVSGELEEGYGFTGTITPDITEVKVAGKASVLAKLSEIDIDEVAINAEGRKETFTTMVDIRKYLPENVTLAAGDFDGKVSVKVGVGKLSSEIVQIPKDSVSFNGIDLEEQKVTIVTKKSYIEVKLIGMPQVLNELKPEELKLEFDFDELIKQLKVDKLREGTHNVPVSIALPEGITMEDEELLIECKIKNL